MIGEEESWGGRILMTGFDKTGGGFHPEKDTNMPSHEIWPLGCLRVAWVSGDYCTQ